MKNVLKKYWDMFFLFFFPLGACAVLWFKSDLPPYGTPFNELSDHYWGILMDIARQWKSGDFYYWTRSIGGGYCLYSSGFYPLWVPFNVFAKFLSYDHFYIFKLIEPYFIGLFSMALLLRHGFRLSYSWTAYGALAYMGFVFTRHVGILHHPFFLWACAFFPLILYVHMKLRDRPLYLRAAVLGAFMSLIFIGGGAGQYAQMIIWGLMLLGVEGLFFVKDRSLVQRIGIIIFSCVVFLFFSFMLASAQLLPTVGFTIFESSRTLGEYPINNFPFFRNDYKGDNSIVNIFIVSIWTEENQGVRAFWALMIFAAGKMIVDWKLFRQWCSTHRSWLAVVLATVFFFLLPPFAETLSLTSPVFAKLFNPLRMFTFGYCGFMIDMVMVVLLAVLLNFKTFSDQQDPEKRIWKQVILLAFMLLAILYLFFPLWVSQLFPYLQKSFASIHLSQRYLTLLCLLVLVFPVSKIKILQTAVLFAALLFLGGKLLLTSYVWGEKGQQTTIQGYFLDTPEHQFYRQMKGRYYLPYVDPSGNKYRYESMAHNYDLLFEIHGANGFLNIPPKRMSSFLNAFHNNIYWTKNRPSYKFIWGSTPASLVTHFPVEFTTIGKGAELPWAGFKKTVAGKEYDVWVRDGPVEPVRFAKELRIVSYRELIDSYDRPYEGIIYMTEEDAKRFSPSNLSNVPALEKAAYRYFERKAPDYLVFDVETPDDVFVVLPEMFQNGWRLKVNGQSRSGAIFPANSIFSGFLLEKGRHHVEVLFRPVLWEAGWVLMLIGFALFGWIMLTNFVKRKKR